MSKSNLLINQEDNYNANFGEVYRSSAVFWAINNNKIKTIISFSNYWKFKNDIEVTVLVNLRTLDGKLLKRHKIDFGSSWVSNYFAPNDFEGSIEVEAFSLKNMRIPYAAIMAIYECENSISMVHSYSRIYSHHEIEEKRVISNGEESCWTIRDNDRISSFAVIHNGCNLQSNQEIKLSVRNCDGEEITKIFNLDEIKPYQTVIFEPIKYFDNLIEWLKDKPGNARISFTLNGSFTRMLCGNKYIDNTQLQVTHSNFDYSTHSTNKIFGNDVVAYMKVPSLPERKSKEVIIYPDFDKGEYAAKYNNKFMNFKTGQLNNLEFSSSKEESIDFTKKDESIPSRLVTGLRLKSNENTIPAECSLGIMHYKRPKKNFHWMLVSNKFNSIITWVDYSEIYGGCKDGDEFVFKLYNSKNDNTLEKKMKKFELPENQQILLTDLFSLEDYDNYLYLSVWCSYGGFTFFSTLKKKDSITIEHSF